MRLIGFVLFSGFLLCGCIDETKHIVRYYNDTDSATVAEFQFLGQDTTNELYIPKGELKILFEIDEDGKGSWFSRDEFLEHFSLLRIGEYGAENLDFVHGHLLVEEFWGEQYFYYDVIPEK